MSKETVAAFEKRMLTISVPEGFTFRFDKKDTFVGKMRTFILEKDGDTKIEFDNDECGSGHTSFTTDKGHWLSFDRTGVSDSFSHVETMWGDRNGKMFGKQKRLKGKELDVLINEQLANIFKRREYYKTAIKIPGIPFTTAPERVQSLKDNLKKNKCLHFSPSGFGTGYTITLKPVQGLRYGETKAPKELEAFFGITPLYIHTYDAD